MSAEPCTIEPETLAHELGEIPGVEIKLDEPLAPYTSFGVGGPADVLVMPTSPEALAHVMRLASNQNLEPVILGNGTNLVVRDGGVRGIVVITAGGMNHIRLNGTDAVVEAGATLASLCCFCAHRGLKGIEFAAGIPGTLGGALIMNAGANGGEIGSITRWVEVLRPDGETTRHNAAELDFRYRHSTLRHLPGAIVRASLNFTQGDPDEVHNLLCETMAVRCARQPVSLPSAGSIFKRPKNDYAGRLLEAAGAKGITVGGAEVSRKHANFVVNQGNATAQDVLDLIEKARSLVHQQFGVTLEPEVHVVGEDAK